MYPPPHLPSVPTAGRGPTATGRRKQQTVSIAATAATQALYVDLSLASWDDIATQVCGELHT